LERTLVLIKPDGVKRNLIGEIISFYENKGLNIIGLKLLRATEDRAKEHYKEHVGREYFKKLMDYITEDRLCAIVIEGHNAIEIVRKLNGHKNPLEAEVGSIRGRFSKDKTRNLVHASDSLENAEREIGIWFKEDEVFGDVSSEETKDLFKVKNNKPIEV